MLRNLSLLSKPDLLRLQQLIKTAVAINHKMSLIKGFIPWNDPRTEAFALGEVAIKECLIAIDKELKRKGYLVRDNTLK